MYEFIALYKTPTFWFVLYLISLIFSAGGLIKKLHQDKSDEELRKIAADFKERGFEESITSIVLNLDRGRPTGGLWDDLLYDVQDFFKRKPWYNWWLYIVFKPMFYMFGLFILSLIHLPFID